MYGLRVFLIYIRVALLTSDNTRYSRSLFLKKNKQTNLKQIKENQVNCSLWSTLLYHSLEWISVNARAGEPFNTWTALLRWIYTFLIEQLYLQTSRRLIETNEGRPICFSCLLKTKANFEFFEKRQVDFCMLQTLKKCRSKVECLIFEMPYIRKVNSQADSIRVKLFV